MFHLESALLQQKNEQLTARKNELTVKRRNAIKKNRDEAREVVVFEHRRMIDVAKTRLADHITGEKEAAIERGDYDKNPDFLLEVAKDSSAPTLQLAATIRLSNMLVLPENSNLFGEKIMYELSELFGQVLLKSEHTVIREQGVCGLANLASYSVIYREIILRRYLSACLENAPFARGYILWMIANLFDEHDPMTQYEASVQTAVRLLFEPESLTLEDAWWAFIQMASGDDRQTIRQMLYDEGIFDIVGSYLYTFPIHCIHLLLKLVAYDRFAADKVSSHVAIMTFVYDAIKNSFTDENVEHRRMSRDFTIALELCVKLAAQGFLSRFSEFIFAFYDLKATQSFVYKHVFYMLASSFRFVPPPEYLTRLVELYRDWFADNMHMHRAETLTYMAALRNAAADDTLKGALANNSSARLHMDAVLTYPKELGDAAAYDYVCQTVDLLQSMDASDES